MNNDFSVWILHFPERPWTVNAERNWHHHKRAKLVKHWREEFKKLAETERIPPLEVMYIEVEPNLADRRFQDTAACVLAAKAAIDGIVDAGVVPDDKPEFLKWIKFFPCRHTPGESGLTVRVIGKIAQKNSL